MYYVAGVFAVVLAAFTNRYGYHRDELYFLAAGRHPSWGYADQPPLVPAVARVMAAVDPDSLVLLRIPAIAAAVVVVLCAGLMARELGGGRGAQALSAGAVASSALVVAAGHQLGTTVFDLAVWSLIVLVVLRLLRDEAGGRWWLAVGALVGVGLLNKVLLVFPVAALVVALLLAGPRKVFATKYFPCAIGIAMLLWLPYLWWQARNGWPQWQLSRAIADGSSGTSNSRVEFVGLQFVLMGLVLVPLWGFGLWRLWRTPRYRAFPICAALLFAGFLTAGGKAYYLGSMYPILLAAGSVPLAKWLAGHRKVWAAVIPVAIVQLATSAVLFLPVLPVAALRDSPVLAVNYDAGETVGWPEFTRQVADARTRVAPDAPILTADYGEAGAIERFGAAYGLPVPHSGHNAYWWWGPPPGSTPVLAVGLAPDRLALFCNGIQPAGRIDNGLGIDNDEQHALLYTCTPRSPWQDLWPELKRLG
ncbi:glycosyltransferase family 39 protein [Nocardia mexicana]|uniref:Dolichyl-phosphate-mannose-protein mannosyltransferase n=1 Tax=Nocardia mexicana TaxID=279262 RepID=A0A370GDG4_9NOCA|nr:glycosyltransferase family 39 protein [Nocardia mexicana]RDI41737.1 dolichyl-phosphate-mannose-protein mannosyltransferase [Nocardia mexicana]